MTALRIIGRCTVFLVALVLVEASAVVFKDLTGQSGDFAAGLIMAYVYLFLFPSMRPWRDG